MLRAFIPPAMDVFFGSTGNVRMSKEQLSRAAALGWRSPPMCWTGEYVAQLEISSDAAIANK